MLRTVFPSIIRSPRLYIQRQVYVILKFQEWIYVYIYKVVKRKTKSVKLLVCMYVEVKCNDFYLQRVLHFTTLYILE